MEKAQKKLDDKISDQEEKQATFNALLTYLNQQPNRGTPTQHADLSTKSKELDSLTGEIRSERENVRTETERLQSVKADLEFNETRYQTLLVELSEIEEQIEDLNGPHTMRIVAKTA